MLTITPTTDVDAMLVALKHPAVWKAATGGNGEPIDPLIVLEDPKNKFFLVTDEGNNLGFTGYIFIQDGIYAIHNCLLTIGSRSFSSIESSLDQMRELGARAIISAYPSSNKAARAMAAKLGFKDDRSGLVENAQPAPEGQDYLYQYLILNT